jgi:hypothetical protein
MKHAERRQVKVRVTSELGAHVKRYCAAHNCTEQSLMMTALEQYLTSTNDRSVLMRRLDLLGLEVQRLGVACDSIGESFGTFVQLWFAHNPELPEATRKLAGRDAARRYRRFLERVVRAVGDGQTLLGQLTGPRAFVVGDAPSEQERP